MKLNGFENLFYWELLTNDLDGFVVDGVMDEGRGPVCGRSHSCCDDGRHGVGAALLVLAFLSFLTLRPLAL